MGILGHDEIRTLHDAVISANLVKSRDVLLVDIPRQFTARMPSVQAPGDQILLDLGHLNDVGRLADGSAPLAVWLANAAALSRAQVEGALFRAALDRCREALAGLPARVGDGARAVTLLPPPPRPPERFVGRAAELARLEAIFSARDSGNARARAAIRGVGGIGKTAFALHLAERLRGIFPGGILWAQVGTERDAGERGAAVNPEWVLRSTLLKWEAELGRVDDAARPLAALYGSVRALLTSRVATLGRCLVVLDNVDTSATLEPLLEALPHCAILITTRQTDLASSEGMEVVALGGLDRVSSQAYVEAELPADDTRLAGVAPVLDHVEHHPLAVRLITAALKADPALTPDRALARLRTRRDSSPRGLQHVPRSLQDCFRVSIAQIPLGRRPLLVSMASQSPLSCSIDAIDHVSGICDLARTREGLAELCSAGVVEEAEGRYRIHRLLRDYLREMDRRTGFGLVPPTWEIASLPFLLARLGPLGRRTSAGLAAYDRRQETWFARYARQHTGDPAALRREWDAILLGLYRRRGADPGDATPARVARLKSLLIGADLNGVRLARVVLDGAVLDAARLERADLSGRRLSRWPPVREVARGALVMLGWTAVALGALVLWQGVAAIRAWQDAKAARADVPFVVGVQPVLLELVAIALAIPLGEQAAKVALAGGQWLDGLSPARRLFAERILAAVASALVARIALLIAFALFDGSSGRMESELRAIGVAAMIPGPVVVLFSLVAFRMTGALDCLGVGGLARRSAAGVLVVLLLAAVLLVGVVAGHATTGRIGYFDALLISFAAASVIAPFYAASHDPEAGIPLHSVQTSYLRGASLVGANLRSANLRWVRLGRADLRLADLQGAQLEHAELTGANLQGARLAGADLRGADLSGANFADATHDATTRWPEGYSVSTSTVPAVAAVNNGASTSMRSAR